MKAKKILAFVLVLAIAIVPLCVPVSAADVEFGRTFDELTTVEDGIRLSEYGTAVIDGEKDAVYTEYGHVTSNYTAMPNNPSSFEAFYINDGNYLYAYVVVTIPKTQKTLSNDDLTRLYIDFYNKDTKVEYKANNDYQNKYFNTDTSKITVPTGSATKYNGGQFQYVPANNSVSGGRGAQTGIGSVANKDVAYKLFYDDEANTDIGGYILEARIALPDYVKAALTAGKNPVIGVGYEIRESGGSADNNYNCAYFAPHIKSPNSSALFSFIWGDYTLCPDLILSGTGDNSAFKALVESAKVADVAGKTVALDGALNADEGWADLPFALLDTTVSATPAKVTDKVSNVRVSADEHNIYIGFETYNLTSTDAYFQVAFGKDSEGNFYGAGSKNNFVTVHVELDDTATPIGGISYSDSAAYAAGDALYDGTKAAVAKTADKIVAEVKIPIPAALIDQRVYNNLVFAVGVKESFAEANGVTGYTPSEGWDAAKALISITLPMIENTDEATLPSWIAASKAETNNTSLEGITVNAIGDDYLTGGSIGGDYVWSALLATKYNWVYSNAAKNGTSIAKIADSDERPISQTYRAATNNDPDIVIISGGHEDLRAGVPIGDINSTDISTFMGALNVLFDGMRTKYPDAMFVYTTTWNVPSSEYLAYAQAAEQVCEAQGVYCFKAYDPAVSGVDMAKADFVSQYVMSDADYDCLKLSGMKLVMPAYEKFIADSLADWAVNKDAILAARPTLDDGKDTDDGDNGNNSGAEDTTPSTQTPSADTTVSDDKKGCGSYVGASALVLLATTVAAGTAFGKKTKKKED